MFLSSLELLCLPKENIKHIWHLFYLKNSYIFNFIMLLYIYFNVKVTMHRICLVALQMCLSLWSLMIPVFLSTLSLFSSCYLSQYTLSEKKNASNPRKCEVIYFGMLIMLSTLTIRKRKHRVGVSSVLSWSWSWLCLETISETWDTKWCDIFINVKAHSNDSSFNKLVFTSK